MTRLEAVEACQRFEDKVVPLEMVRSATEDKVVLNEGLDDFNELPPLEETHFVRARRGGDTAKYPGEHCALEG